MGALKDYPPLFIVGAPRSGTTLLQTLIDGYSPIAIPPESHVFPRFFHLFGCYGDLHRDANLTRLIGDLLSDEKVRGWGMNASIEEFRRGLAAPTIRDVVARLYGLYAEQQGKPRWGDKTTVHVLYMNEIRSLFPEAKFIHLVRDGRDVAESLFRVAIGKKSTWANAHRWVGYLEAAEAFQRQVPPGVFLEVRYENLVRQPEEELRRVFAFLGVDAAAPAGRAVPETRLKQHYLERAVHHGELNAPISDQKIGTFKTGLARRDVEAFEAVAGGTLTRYGYALVTSGRARLTWKDHLRFAFQDTVVRYQRKIQDPAQFKQLGREFRETTQLHLRNVLRTRWRRQRAAMVP